MHEIIDYKVNLDISFLPRKLKDLRGKVAVAAGSLVEIVLVVLFGLVEATERFDLDRRRPSGLPLKGADHLLDLAEIVLILEKTPVRYLVPSSPPCRLTLNGSMMFTNSPTRRFKETSPGSNLTKTN